MNRNGFLPSGHPYTTIDGIMVVDYMSYDQYLHQKRMEDPKYAKMIKDSTNDMKKIMAKFSCSIR